jgi:hypothetical protein
MVLLFISSLRKVLRARNFKIITSHKVVFPYNILNEAVTTIAFRNTRIGKLGLDVGTDVGGDVGIDSGWCRYRCKSSCVW